ncbi:hypothetical protein PRSY57_1367300 [Plasmodium reichenowi]|uniref:Ribosomal protein L1 n=1 Tax=Plasmodium reichenowi TaxID=5854 RepID=A0A151L810_PLARE|nr:hypothetical protein PRSY57_1367300 [Plasmodium reichenowi]KYN95091.1 hypothetical protein PRSY57_1367300 [Plasmodium reichenowi]
MKIKNKKKEILEKKKKENSKFLRYVKNNQKYEKFQKAILLNNKNQRLNKKIHPNIKIKNNNNNNNNINENSINLKKSDEYVIEQSTFYKAYNYIFDRGEKEEPLNEQQENLFYDSYLIYCNFDLSSIYNIGKHYNFSIELRHSYYSSVLILVNDNSDKWKKLAIENKLRKIRKIMTYDKFEAVYNKDDLINEITNKFDLYIFDASIRSKKYSHVISKIKKHNKNFTTLQLNEDNFVEDVDQATRKAFADLNKGSTHSIPIGFLNLGKEKLYDNIQQATKRMLEFYEQKNVSVVSINLRYMSMTIPLYIHALKNIIHPGYY